MKIKTPLQFIGIIAFFLVAGGVASYSLLVLQSHTNTPIAVAPDPSFGWKYPVVKFPITGTGDLAYSDIRDPGGTPQGLPVRLKIPIIGVDAAIEDALITSDGRMDVPSGSVDVAWFALGPHPGQVGSAVVGGHFGIQNGVKFVFFDLDKLQEGDKVYVIDDRGNTLTFQVTSVKLFDRNADATTVFTSHDGVAHLNLITCEGVWNQVNGSYPERRVIFTNLIPNQGAPPPPPPVFAFYRSLNIGATGADVIALQTALEQKGFLVMPPGVTHGFFGAVTRAAVARYQTSAGLPSVGVFGPLTQARLISELTFFPNAGVSAISGASVSTGAVPVSNATATAPVAFHTLVEYAQSLYATPLDGFITLILLIAIVVVLSVLIWR